MIKNLPEEEGFLLPADQIINTEEYYEEI